VATAHGGEVLLDDRPGGGLVAAIRLPVLADAEAAP
jgi:signal transduction histidine kinase